jgi:hypothetical protein
MMRFLNRHHESEDQWLYPLVRRRNPVAGPLLDAMDEDHQQISPAITGVAEAASAFAGSPAARAGLERALDRLTGVLLPHLQREEDEMMPVVSATPPNGVSVSSRPPAALLSGSPSRSSACGSGPTGSSGRSYPPTMIASRRRAPTSPTSPKPNSPGPASCWARTRRPGHFR